jgi:acyl carrier protein
MSYTKEEIREKINGILFDKLYVEEKDLMDDALMASDLGADSLDVIELTMELENTFQIHISDNDLDGMFNCPLKKIYELVEEKLRDEN